MWVGGEAVPSVRPRCGLAVFQPGNQSIQGSAQNSLRATVSVGVALQRKSLTGKAIRNARLFGLSSGESGGVMR